jgi:CBS-domain-containing membrane protein
MKIRLKVDHEYNLIDPKFYKKKGRYLFQSLLAAFALFIILIVGVEIADGAIIAGIAGSTALIFFAPRSYASSTRRIVGGHTLAVIVTLVMFNIFSLFTDISVASNFVIYFYSSLALATLILFEGIFNCEHAPSAGCLLGLTIGGISLDAVIFIIFSALMLSLLRFLLFNWIKNIV